MDDTSGIEQVEQRLTNLEDTFESRISALERLTGLQTGPNQGPTAAQGQPAATQPSSTAGQPFTQNPLDQTLPSAGQPLTQNPLDQTLASAGQPLNPNLANQAPSPTGQPLNPNQANQPPSPTGQPLNPNQANQPPLPMGQPVDPNMTNQPPPPVQDFRYLPNPQGVAPSGSAFPPVQQYPQPMPTPFPVQNREPVPKKTSAEKFEQLLKWSGSVLITMAALFMVKVAIDRGGLTPEARLALASVGGVALMLAAFVVNKRRKPWAIALANSSAVVLSICAVATHIWLDLANFRVATLILGAVGAACAACSYKLLTESATTTSAVGILGGSAWLFPWQDVAQTSNEFMGEFVLGFVAVLVTAAAAILSWVRPWPWLRTIVGWLGAVVILIALAVVEPANTNASIATGYILVALQAALLWFGPLPVASREYSFKAFDMRLVAAIGSWVALSLLPIVGDSASPSYGQALAIAASLLLVAAALSYKFVPKILFVSHLLSASVAATIALAALTEGQTLLVGLAANAVAVTAIGFYFSDVALKLNGYLLAAAAFIGGLVSMAIYLENGVWDGGDFLSHLTAIVCLAGVAAVARFFPVLTDTDTEAGADTTADTDPLGISEEEQLELVAAPPYNFLYANWDVGVVWFSLLTFVYASLGPHLENIYLLIPLSVGLAAATVFASRRLGDTVKVLGFSLALSVTTATAIVLLATLLSTDKDTLVTHLCTFSLVAGLFGALYLLWRKQPEKLEASDINVDNSLAMVGWGFLMTWLGTVLLDLPQGQALLSGTWALMAGLAIAAGFWWRLPVVRLAGLLTLTTLLIKLFTVDLAEIDTLVRAFLFCVVGVGLMRLGFVLPRLDRPAEQELNDATPAQELQPPPPPPTADDATNF